MIRDGQKGEGARNGGHTSEVPSPAVPRLVDTGTWPHCGGEKAYILGTRAK